LINLRIGEKGFNSICIADSLEKRCPDAEKLATFGPGFDKMERYE
jgi:hypothetical protein